MNTTENIVKRYNLTKVTCINGYYLTTGEHLTTERGLGMILNSISMFGPSTKKEIYSRYHFRFVGKVISGYHSSIFSFARRNGLLDYNTVNHRWDITEKGTQLLLNILDKDNANDEKKYGF